MWKLAAMGRGWGGWASWCSDEQAVAVLRLSRVGRGLSQTAGPTRRAHLLHTQWLVQAVRAMHVAPGGAHVPYQRRTYRERVHIKIHGGSPAPARHGAL